MQRVNFKKLPSPSFIIQNGYFPLKPENILLLEWIKSQISAQESAPPDIDMLGWMRYYLKKEVVGVESWHTARAKIYDLWKFLNFFYRFYPGKDLLAVS